MLFTNSRTSDNNRFAKQNLIYNVKPLPVKMTTSIAPIISNSNSITNTPKIEWGPVIWYFFHILAEKVNPDDFPIVRAKLLDTINVICMNLPCPTCSIHASKHISKLQFSTIRTKEDLKRMLLNFHNEVNKQTGKPEFSLIELNEKYSKGNLHNIIPLFFKFFQDKHKTVHMISNDMYIMRISATIRKWLSENLHYFTA
jgi:hypothetical protein